MNTDILGGSYSPDAVILGNGDFPTHHIPLAVLRRAKFLCCCDGAAARCIGQGLSPDAIVGDGDSLSQEFKEKHRDLLHIIREQDDNDQTKATRFCLGRGFKNIAYIGATGRREDHTIGNISLLGDYLAGLGLHPVMLTDYGYFLPVHGSGTVSVFPGQQVSVFNLSCTRLESRGMRWPSSAFTRLWQGTLNEATANEISIDADGDLILYLTYSPKSFSN